MFSQYFSLLCKNHSGSNTPSLARAATLARTHARDGAAPPTDRRAPCTLLTEHARYQPTSTRVLNIN
eukprot:6209019-Pleurochrysis_carterae.AAC.1